MYSNILFCTAGFGDVLAIGRQTRRDVYAQVPEKCEWEKFIGITKIIEVNERVASDGSELIQLDRREFIAALEQQSFLPKKIFISLLHSKKNPKNEIVITNIVRTVWPAAIIYTAHQITKKDGEYERLLDLLNHGGETPSVRRVERDSKINPEVNEILCNATSYLRSRARSPAIKNAGDCAYALFNLEGDLIADGIPLPLLHGSLSISVKETIKSFPPSNAEPSDCYFFNDPWSGGTHLPDIIMISPVFSRQKIIGYVACIAHHIDVGGISPGSLPEKSTNIFMEGLRIPLINIGQGTNSARIVLKIIQANSRFPNEIKRDLVVQLHALRDASRRFCLLFDRHRSLSKKLNARLINSAIKMRSLVSSVNDGEYVYEDAMDAGSVGKQTKIKVRLLVKHSALTVDLTESGDQEDFPINSSFASTYSAISYFACSISNSKSFNDGFVKPIKILTRNGSAIDPCWPSPLNARTNLVKILANCLMGAWALTEPSKYPASNAGETVVLTLVGIDDQNKDWISTEIISSGAGGGPIEPGRSGISTDISNAKNTPIEIMEKEYPIRINKFCFHFGSGGDGIYRGGDGLYREYILLSGEGKIFYRGERHTTCARGILGGEDGSRAFAKIVRSTGAVIELGSIAEERWDKGDKLIIATAGGGGWGNPVKH